MNLSVFPHVNNNTPAVESYEQWMSNAVLHWDTYYSSELYSNLMLGFDEAYKSQDREGLLNHMLAQESSREHWGYGNNDNDYRPNMGSADSRASFGFSQIQARYVYGARNGVKNSVAPVVNSCPEIRVKNLYRPNDAVGGMAAWLIGTACGGSMRQAYNSSYEKSYVNEERTYKLIRANYKAFDDSINELEADFLSIPIDGVYSDDIGSYQRLIKAIAGYNQGAAQSIWSSYSLPEAMQELTTSLRDKGKINCAAFSGNKKKFCQGWKYSIEVREKMSSSAPAYQALPLLEYTFEYEQPDWRRVAVETETGTTEELRSVNLRVCFSYSEHDWVTASQSFESVKDAARDDIYCGENPDLSCGHPLVSENCPE